MGAAGCDGNGGRPRARRFGPSPVEGGGRGGVEWRKGGLANRLHIGIGGRAARVGAGEEVRNASQVTCDQSTAPRALLLGEGLEGGAHRSHHLLPLSSRLAVHRLQLPGQPRQVTTHIGPQAVQLAALLRADGLHPALER
eukprot:EG_transcript_39778